MKAWKLDVLSLHPNSANPLGLDLKQILAALGPVSKGWLWFVKDLDCLVTPPLRFTKMIESAGPEGIWMHGEVLIALAEAIYQTIEGEFVAFDELVGPDDPGLSSFPKSRAILAIIAVDGCAFDIYSKNPAITERLLTAFPEAVVEDPEFYFPSNPVGPPIPVKDGWRPS